MVNEFPVPFGSHEHRGGKRGSILLALAVFAFAYASPGAAQSGEKRDNVGTDAVEAVTQPLSDLNLRSKEIPLVLQLAEAEPHDLASVQGCPAINTEIARLEEVLGPDADAPAKADGLVNKGLKLGGNVLGGFIPFRGLIRQLSGANAERARWESAIYSGVARRSFLKGYAEGMGCPDQLDTAVQSAEEVLGMAGEKP